MAAVFKTQSPLDAETAANCELWRIVDPITRYVDNCVLEAYALNKECTTSRFHVRQSLSAVIFAYSFNI